MAPVTKTLPIPGSKSQPLKSTRASITFDPANPNASRTLTVTNVTKNRRGRTTATTDTIYTQGADGMFRDTSGTLWAGEYDGGGGKVRNTMGKAINSANVPDSTVDQWGADATGLKKKEGSGSDTADGADKGTTTQSATPRQPKRIGNSNYARGSLRYPLALIDETDFMMISMYEYVAGGFGSGSTTSKGGYKRTQKPTDRIKDRLGGVILPIPPGLTDGNTVGWGEHKMNAIQMGLAGGALKTMNSGEPFDTVAKEVGGAITAAQKNPAAKEMAQTYLLSQVGALGATQDQLMARTSGKILNPNLELLFAGPALRSFQYSFRLTARTAKEAVVIRKIIRFFKQGMAAKTGGGTYLQTPNVFHCQFFNGSGKEHEYIGKLKMAACTSFNVNYVPDGSYMTLPNSAMTAYEIGMGFQELDPVLDEDYEDNDEIGY